MAASQPSIGNWYRLSGGELFEVVAIDDDDGTIDIQYFDGTVEEMDREDWETQWEDSALEAAEAPEDWTGSVDVEAATTMAAAPTMSTRIRPCAPARSTASTCSNSIKTRRSEVGRQRCEIRIRARSARDRRSLRAAPAQLLSGARTRKATAGVLLEQCAV